MDRERRITVSVTEEFHRSVRIKAAERGVSISEVVRALLRLWLSGKIELPEK